MYPRSVRPRVVAGSTHQGLDARGTEEERRGYVLADGVARTLDNRPGEFTDTRVSSPCRCGHPGTAHQNITARAISVTGRTVQSPPRSRRRVSEKCSDRRPPSVMRYSLVSSFTLCPNRP